MLDSVIQTVNNAGKMEGQLQCIIFGDENNMQTLSDFQVVDIKRMMLVMQHRSEKTRIVKRTIMMILMLTMQKTNTRWITLF